MIFQRDYSVKQKHVKRKEKIKENINLKKIKVPKCGNSKHFICDCIGDMTIGMVQFLKK
jgi:hypothetical protein